MLVSMATPTTTPTRGYSATKDQLLKRLRRIEGQVLGMIIGTALGWSNGATIAASILLAFFFGYGLTSLPLLRAGLGLRRAAPLAFASDTLSITTMEIVDTLIIVLIPGAMAAGLGD